MTLRPPIKDHLVSPIDASGVTRIRAGVVAREPRRSRARWVVAAAAVAAVAVLGTLAWPGAPPSKGPLTYQGRGLTVMEVDAQRTIALDDGSRITLGAGTRLVPRTNNGRELVLDLVRGRVELDVRPGGGRRWMVEAEWATVEVVGTRFVVVRDERSVQVSVQRGEVVVRGERVLGRERHLVAGQTLRVEAPAPQPPPSTAEREAGERAEPAPRPPAHTVERPESAPRAPVHRRPHPPPAQPVDEVAPLLASADAARAGGRPREAAEHLALIVRDHPDDRRAALAAFTLARLELDVLDRPDEALDALERAIALGLPAPIVVDAQARRVEALARCGRVEEARAAASRFQTEHPESPRLPEVQRWVRRAPP